MNNKTYLVPIRFSSQSADYIKKYDLKSNSIWSSDSPEIKKIREELREHYKREQDGCCSYCRIDNPQNHGLSWDVEHVAPQGDFPQFLFEPRNLALSCKDCNTAKNKKKVLDLSKVDVSKEYPEDGDCFIIVHPHFDCYQEHITIKRVGEKIIYYPQEGKGINTYKMCNLSRYIVYKTHNITDANLANAIMERLLDLSASGSISLNHEHIKIVGDSVTKNPLSVEIETSFKAVKNESEQ
ncbi:HNH endonuclease [Klebsiella oxytoca]|uniref:HNH endonuclease n=1 Tax=Klebsiella oxytoca TaxID=571 RepID=UPI00301C18F7